MKKIVILLFSLLCIFNSLKAQEDKYNATVVVIGNFQPTINDASKINFSPSIKDSVIVHPNLEYSTYYKNINTKYNIEPIKPVKLIDEKITKLYKYLAKAGLGTYTTPYAELFYSNQRSRKWSNNFNLKHISSSGKIDNVGYPGWSDNIVEANSGRYFKNSALWGGVDFSRNVVHYYGFNPDTVSYNDNELLVDKKSIKQRFVYTGAYLKYLNTGIDSSALDYKFGLNYNYTEDYYKRKEHDVEFSGLLSKNLELFKITKSQNIGIKINTDFVSEILIDKPVHNNSLIVLRPFLNTKFGFFDINIGVNASITADSISYLHFYPEAEVHFRIIRSILDIYGGITGNIIRNDYRSLSKENPFVSPYIPGNFSNNKLEIYGGINASVSKNIDFYAKLSNSNIDNMQFFNREYNNFTSSQRWLNRFTSVYDNVHLLKISSGLTFQQQERLKIGIRGEWNKYDLDTLEKPWHKPPYELCLSAMYNIQNKIITRTEIFYCGPSYGLATASYNSNFLIPHKIKSYIDINLLLEYKYSKVLSCFINFYNISASRFEKWLDYPSRRFSLLAGITYAF